MDEERPTDDEPGAALFGDALLDDLVSKALPATGADEELMGGLAGDFAVAARVAADLADRPDIDDTLIDRVDEVLGALAEQADRIRRIMARRRIEEFRKVDWSSSITQSIRSFREGLGWTQDEIAGAMRRLGFNRWKRITVAEIESGKRKVRLEELAGLAILFGTTVADFLTDLGDDEALVLNGQLSVVNRDAAYLVARWPEPGASGAPKAEVQARLAGVRNPGGEDDWRPIARRAARQTMIDDDQDADRQAMIDKEATDSYEAWAEAGYPD